MAGVKSSGALLASLLILVMALLPGVNGSPPIPLSEPRSGQPATGSEDARALGTSSCSARGCHGRINEVAEGTSRVKRNEYTTWMMHDKHADAYNVLLNARSREIAEKLGRFSGKTIPAHEDARCLACHSSPATVSPTGPLSAFRHEGVSCEACHGSASHWLEPHLQKTWASQPLEIKQQAGMIPMENLAARVAMCAGCHVGAPAGLGSPMERDVNHDLIAAGHPRLAFEFSWFQAQMPDHWRSSTDPASGLAGSARAWAVGQVAVVEASLRLLQGRASNPSHPWPEFAEYDCFACHHDLKPRSWRQQAGYPDRTPGSPPWGSWTTALLPEVLAGSSPIAPPGGDVLLADLDALRKLMSHPTPDREEAGRKAAQLVDRLETAARFLADAAVDEPRVSTWLDAVLKGAPAQVPPSWARDTQRYLAVAALQRALQSQSKGEKSPEVESFLRQFLESLRFEPSLNSPSHFDNSAAATTREASHAGK